MKEKDRGEEWKRETGERCRGKRHQGKTWGREARKRDVGERDIGERHGEERQEREMGDGRGERWGAEEERHGGVRHRGEALGTLSLMSRPVCSPSLYHSTVYIAIINRIVV